MPNMPLFPCSYPGCRRRQKESRCPEHRWNGDYHVYRAIRRIVMLAHLRRYGLRCPGAENHPAHRVASRSDLTVDHIIPRSRGGSDHRSNLRVVCGAFNSARGNKMIDYRSELRIPHEGQRHAEDQGKEDQAPRASMKVVHVPDREVTDGRRQARPEAGTGTSARPGDPDRAQGQGS